MIILSVNYDGKIKGNVYTTNFISAAHFSYIVSNCPQCYRNDRKLHKKDLKSTITNNELNQLHLKSFI